ncbi:hypothetical protein [Enterobacter kobei]|uniref:hypothetical protein n=1 Tax=Enterobacter kobei TaxID=208224 RepID=UPI001EE1F9B1|nr:hypothetical protein [Enterobacter kobei]
MKAVVVFTGKDLNIMRTEGGSGYWHARTDRLNDAEYLIAVRNRRETWAVKDLEHGTAFLIAKITGCFKNPDYDDRNVITFDEYAVIHSPDAWKMLTGGQRYPVAYLNAQEAFLRIGVTPEQLNGRNSILHPHRFLMQWFLVWLKRKQKNSPLTRQLKEPKRILATQQELIAQP